MKHAYLYFALAFAPWAAADGPRDPTDRKSTRLNSSHSQISYAVFCLKKKKATYVRLGLRQGAAPALARDLRGGARASVQPRARAPAPRVRVQATLPEPPPR